MTRKELDVDEGDEDATRELDIVEDDAFIQHFVKDRISVTNRHCFLWPGASDLSPLLLSPYAPGAWDLGRKLYCTVRGTV
jgi:hypothetical protein